MIRRQREVQLSLDLPEPVAPEASVTYRNVFSFVDAGTLAVRKAAIKRVLASRIFAHPWQKTAN